MYACLLASFPVKEAIQTDNKNLLHHLIQDFVAAMNSDQPHTFSTPSLAKQHFDTVSLAIWG